MAKEKPVKKDDSEQSRRFEEKARELGCDESGNLFGRAFKKLFPLTKRKRASE